MEKCSEIGIICLDALTLKFTSNVIPRNCMDSAYWIFVSIILRIAFIFFLLVEKSIAFVLSGNRTSPLVSVHISRLSSAFYNFSLSIVSFLCEM